MTKKTYHGSCHCGAVRFEAELDLADGTRRCNCSFCHKARWWKAFALEGEFRLLAGVDVLSDYQAAESTWPEDHVHHYFCSRCGVRGFGKGYLEMEPFNGWFHAVNVACLDDLSEEALATAPVIFEDGKRDRQDREPEITSYL